jgi:hypothetical protein
METSENLIRGPRGLIWSIWNWPIGQNGHFWIWTISGWLSAILIFTKFRKLKTEFCRTFRSFRISLFYCGWFARISQLFSCYEMFCHACMHNVRKHARLEKNTQVFLTFPSHARCLNIPTSFTFLVFHKKWKLQISQFPPFSSLPKTRENSEGTFLNLNHLTPVITPHTLALLRVVLQRP